MVHNQTMKEAKHQRLFPNWEEINKLKNPLTEGELALTKYLDSHLPDRWEIFVQPYMNGDRPDIVVINKNVGIMIIKVIKIISEYN